jgi:hypothetical protein
MKAFWKTCDCVSGFTQGEKMVMLVDLNTKVEDVEATDHSRDIPQHPTVTSP